MMMTAMPVTRPETMLKTMVDVVAPTTTSSLSVEEVRFADETGDACALPPRSAQGMTSSPSKGAGMQGRHGWRSLIRISVRKQGLDWQVYTGAPSPACVCREWAEAEAYAQRIAMRWRSHFAAFTL